MNDIIFECIKITVMIVMLIITRYLIPMLKEKIGADKLATAERWTKLKAQQVLWSESGQDRKAYVTEFLKEILIEKNIALSEEQIDVLIEAAVKQMRLSGNSNIDAIDIKQ